MQGLEAHEGWFWHSTPHCWVPGLQVQLNPPNKSLQVAPFLHGDEAHSFMLVWHIWPVNPLTQVHTNPFSTSLQVAPFWHGRDTQNTIAV
jgi:hypothetical protein